MLDSTFDAIDVEMSDSSASDEDAKVSVVRGLPQK